MSDNHNKPGSVFARAWQIISRDDTISPEEKQSILKLIQVLVEATERSLGRTSGENAQATTQEVISKHSLLAMVKHQADELDAIKRISNLTLSLDLRTVLDGVVTEAM